MFVSLPVVRSRAWHDGRAVVDRLMVGSPLWQWLGAKAAASCTGSVRGSIVFIALLLASCTAEPDQESSPDLTASPSSAACPLTRPNGSNPPGQRGPGQASPLSHGNGQLWVELYPRGVIRPANYGRALPNGTIAVKFPWSRRLT